MRRGSLLVWLALPLLLLLGLRWRSGHQRIEAEVLGASLLERALQAEERLAYRAEVVVTTLQASGFETNYALLTHGGGGCYHYDYQQGPLAGLQVGCDGGLTWRRWSSAGAVEEAPCLPGLAPEAMWDLVLDNYRVEAVGKLPWDARWVHEIVIRPRRQGQPWERLLLDEETALPLLSERWTSQGERLFQVIRHDVRLLAAEDVPALRFSPPESDRHRATLKPFPEGDGEQAERELGFRPRAPRAIPAGYRFISRSIYRCPCGCGMEAAEWHYTDGLQALSVFQIHPDYAGCAFPGGCRTPGGQDHTCFLSKLGAAQMAFTINTSPVCVVVGPLPAYQLRRIAERTVAP